MTAEKIVERIMKHRMEFLQRNTKKEQKEMEAFGAFTNARQKGNAQKFN